MIRDPQLREAKALIDKGDQPGAKAIVVPYLQDNADSADAWWLFALLTGSEDDSVLALQRALKLEPFHTEAKRALEQLKVNPCLKIF